jgi:hypothetical protein
MDGIAPGLFGIRFGWFLSSLSSHSHLDRSSSVLPVPPSCAQRPATAAHALFHLGLTTKRNDLLKILNGLYRGCKWRHFRCTSEPI